jgi:hypothetical protein
VVAVSDGRSEVVRSASNNAVGARALKGNWQGGAHGPDRWRPRLVPSGVGCTVVWARPS